MLRVELFRNNNLIEVMEEEKETSEKQVSVKLNHTQQEIIELLSENSKLSAAKVSEKIGISSRNVENNIKKL